MAHRLLISLYSALGPPRRTALCVVPRALSMDAPDLLTAEL
jgi:hypothetical protein